MLQFGGHFPAVTDIDLAILILLACDTATSFQHRCTILHGRTTAQKSTSTGVSDLSNAVAEGGAGNVGDVFCLWVNFPQRPSVDAKDECY